MTPPIRMVSVPPNVLESIAFNLCSLHDFDVAFVRENERFATAVITEYVRTLSTAPAPEGGAMSIWSDARNVFVRYAELFAMTERYEEASAIADKAAREIEALATREEAPAEAGSMIVKTPCQHCLRMTTVTPESLALYRDHLRAQPPAREDALPVDGDWQSIAMWMGFAASVIKSGEPWTDQCQREFDEAKAAYARLSATHPAPDALRVAVDALEKIKAVRVCRDSANIWTGADACRKIATEALAALQAEQGAK